MLSLELSEYLMNARIVTEPVSDEEAFQEKKSNIRFLQHTLSGFLTLIVWFAFLIPSGIRS